MLAQLATCHFIDLNRNLVFQGFTGSGKSYLACAGAKQACVRRYRTGYVWIPDLEEEWQQAVDKPMGQHKLFELVKFLRHELRFFLITLRPQQPRNSAPNTNQAASEDSTHQ